MANHFDKLKAFPGAIPKGDPAITPYLRDTMLEGDPDVVLRPGDIKDLKEIIRLCRTDKIPVTVCGSRTSMTGSSVALSGALISTEKLHKNMDIEDNIKVISATAQPGTPLINFKDYLEEHGYFYPSHPTSVNDILLSSTVATNATGDDTYKYGSTRRWVRRIKAILMDGREIELVRPAESRPQEIKATGGYYLEGSEIDHFIGSEGTLGIITEVTVDILKGVPEFYSLIIPFPSIIQALSFIVKVTMSQRLKPRSLEFIDDTGLGIMNTLDTFPTLPDQTKALVYTNIEHENGQFEDSVGTWLEELTDFGLDRELLNCTIVAHNRKEKENMHLWRHRIPDWINETCRKYEAEGGGKVGGDWWVPMYHMMEMMDWFYGASDESGIPFIAYAHLGNGHPHTNYLTRNAQERKKAEKLVIEAASKAVKYGGGVAGEHGIGKIKRHLLPIQYTPDVIDKMRALKTHYDPNWLLGRGNVLEPL